MRHTCLPSHTFKTTLQPNSHRFGGKTCNQIPQIWRENTNEVRFKMKFKSVGLFAVFLLLVSSHDGSIPLHGVGGSFQSQSHHPLQWSSNLSQPAVKPEYPLPHGPDSVVSCHWTFQEHWFHVSFVINIFLVLLAVLIIISCVTVCICTLTFVGLSAAVSRIQPMPSHLQHSGTYIMKM